MIYIPSRSRIGRGTEVLASYHRGEADGTPQEMEEWEKKGGTTPRKNRLRFFSVCLGDSGPRPFLSGPLRLLCLSHGARIPVECRHFDTESAEFSPFHTSSFDGVPLHTRAIQRWCVESSSKAFQTFLMMMMSGGYSWRIVIVEGGCVRLKGIVHSFDGGNNDFGLQTCV